MSSNIDDKAISLASPVNNRFQNLQHTFLVSYNCLCTVNYTGQHRTCMTSQSTFLEGLVKSTGYVVCKSECQHECLHVSCEGVSVGI